MQTQRKDQNFLEQCPPQPFLCGTFGNFMCQKEQKCRLGRTLPMLNPDLSFIEKVKTL